MPIYCDVAKFDGFAVCLVASSWRPNDGSVGVGDRRNSQDFVMFLAWDHVRCVCSCDCPMQDEGLFSVGTGDSSLQQPPGAHQARESWNEWILFLRCGGGPCSQGSRDVMARQPKRFLSGFLDGEEPKTELQMRADGRRV